MLWWYLLGGLLLGVLMLALAARPLVGRLLALQRAGLRLRRRAADAQALQVSVEALQASVAGLQDRLAALADRAEQVRRPGAGAEPLGRPGSPDRPG